MQNNNNDIKTISVYKNYKKEIDHNAIFDKLKGLLKKNRYFDRCLS